MPRRRVEQRQGMPPVRTIALSFAAIIAVGTLLLSLPAATRSGEATNLLHALFIATSSTCGVGVTPFDTYTHWNGFGQAVILLLIQIGGISLISFTSFFMLAVRRKMGFKDLKLANEFISMGSLKDTPRLMRVIIGSTFIAELIGAVLLSIRFIPRYGFRGAWISIFTSVSAYCNAGIDIFGIDKPFTSATQFNGDFLVMIVIMALAICGGIGFIVYCDLLSFRKGHRLHLHSKVVLTAVPVLLVIGAAAMFFIEYNNPDTLGSLPLGQKIMASFFQSVNTRSAGFNSVDIAALNDVTKLILSGLMFIGVSSGAAGGGIKITTMVVLIATVISVIRGREDTVIFRRRVEKQVVYRALAIVAISVLVLLVGWGFILFVHRGEGLSPLDTLFECTAVFGTVGLRSNAIPNMSFASEITLTLMMFIGRAGPVSLALALAARTIKSGEVLPGGHIIVG